MSFISFNNGSCINPPFIHTKLTGNASSCGVQFSAATRLFIAGLCVSETTIGINACVNGDYALIEETALVAKGCYSAVSMLTVDYDAPSCEACAVDLTSLLGSLVQNVNSTTSHGGLNGSSSVATGGKQLDCYEADCDL
ncbi:hypothetical protein N431DRAFT_463947 [Stipitochalara longipes BDJ]|nr:hypothetical protein N431DRAFT_463947 [Stipitochalara longipes BDJ]